MKIALIGPTYPFRGGISHYTTLLYRHMKSRHHVVFFSFARQYPQIIFPGKTDIDSSLRPIQEPGVERILDSINPVSWLSVALNIIKSGQHILIIPWWVSFWAPQFWVISFLVKIFSNTKVVFLCHNVVEHESNSVDKILTRVVLRNGDGFVVHSEEDRNNLLAMFPRAKVKKTFHPTYQVFDMGNIEIDHIRKRLGFDGNIVLFFGFVRPYKGLKYLILALPEVLSQVTVTVLVVGEFWKDKEEYLQLIERLGIETTSSLLISMSRTKKFRIISVPLISWCSRMSLQQEVELFRLPSHLTSQLLPLKWALCRKSLKMAKRVTWCRQKTPKNWPGQ
jgi:glycosyltransferase involved in cell wall biosynthesis